MLKPGMVVRDRHGRVILLKGRNACNLAIWWGHRLKPDGKVNKQSMPTLLATDVVGVRFGKGMDSAFWQLFPGLEG